MSEELVARQGGGMLTAFTSFPQMMEVAAALAQSSIVPQRFQNDPGSVMIALDMAARSNLNPLMVMQNLYTVYGTPSFSGKFALTLLRRCGLFSRIGFEYREDGNWEAGVRLVAVSIDGKMTEYGPWIDKTLVVAMGWLSKNDSMWKKMPDQMARYRAASWFANTNCPDVLMGLPTKEEVEEAPEGMRNVTPQTEAPQLQAKPAADAIAGAVAGAAMREEERQKLEEKRRAADERREERREAEQRREDANAAAPAQQQAAAADDACGEVMKRLSAQGAQWRHFTKWCEAHEIALPEKGSGRAEYNRVCEVVLADAALMQDFERELKFNCWLNKHVY